MLYHHQPYRPYRSIRKEVLDNIGLGGPIKPQDTVWGPWRSWRKETDLKIGRKRRYFSTIWEVILKMQDLSTAMNRMLQWIQKLMSLKKAYYISLLYNKNLTCSHELEGFCRNSTNDCLLYLNTWGLPPWAYWSLDPLMGWVKGLRRGTHICLDIFRLIYIQYIYIYYYYYFVFIIIYL